MDKKWRDFTETERNLLLHRAKTPDGPQVHKKVEGLANYLRKHLITRDTSQPKAPSMKNLANELVRERVCPSCQGKRLNPKALCCTVAGCNIHQMCQMELTQLVEVLHAVDDPRGATVTDALASTLERMISIGLPCLFVNRESSTLSGGERQRLKLAKHLGETGNVYVLDEPTTGLHASDVSTIMELLNSLVDRGNTVIVIEHNTNVMRQADWIIDVGPDGGSAGGQVVFSGTVANMMRDCSSITARYLRNE